MAVSLLELGQDVGCGNLLGVQPWMVAADYASQSAFRDKLAGYLKIASGYGWLGPRTIVVWPEYIGTWLAVAETAAAVTRARTLTGAMRAVAIRHFSGLLRAFFAAPERDRLAGAIFRTRARAMALHYQAVFSGLAREYAVTMVAGSTVLPSPKVADGSVTAGDGPLYGTTAVFGPDGRAYPDLVRKAFPIGSELSFMAPGSIEDLPAFETPAGRLGVLICADSWYPASYRRLETLGVALVAVPSYIAMVGAWDGPWRGYDGAQAPSDVDPSDVGRLTEGQAWRKYALAGRMAGSGARAAINVFLSGGLWDLGAEGGSLLVTAAGTALQAESGGPALINLWL